MWPGVTAGLGGEAQTAGRIGSKTCHGTQRRALCCRCGSLIAALQTGGDGAEWTTRLGVGDVHGVAERCHLDGLCARAR